MTNEKLVEKLVAATSLMEAIRERPRSPAQQRRFGNAYRRVYRLTYVLLTRKANPRISFSERADILTYDYVSAYPVELKTAAWALKGHKK